MRNPLVVFSLLLAFAGGMLCGYVWQEREVLLLREGVERLEAEQKEGRQREEALRAQLEELRHVHEAVVEEAKRLQQDLGARLGRLEEMFPSPFQSPTE
jgi:hypothetical protein